MNLSTVVELYHFSSSAGNSYYSSGREAIEFNGVNWQPAPLKRGEIGATSGNERQSVHISSVPDPLLTRYIANYPAHLTTVSIYRYDVESKTAFLIFQGRVAEVALSYNVVSARCLAGTGELERVLPGVAYSAYCQNHLFDNVCKLNQGEFRTTGTIEALKDGYIQVHAAGNKHYRWFARGYVVLRATQDMRLITAHDGDRLYLQLPFDSSAHAGSAVDIYPGCDGAAYTCRHKFNNLNNFLGMPTIPSKNPVIWGA